MSANWKINELALYLQWKSTRVHKSFRSDVLTYLYNSCFDVCLRRASRFFPSCIRKVCMCNMQSVTAASFFLLLHLAVKSFIMYQHKESDPKDVLLQLKKSCKGNMMEQEIKDYRYGRGTILVTAKLNQHFIDTIFPQTQSCSFSPLSAPSAEVPAIGFGFCLLVSFLID